MGALVNREDKIFGRGYASGCERCDTDVGQQDATHAM